MGEGNQTLLLINEKTEKEQLSFMYMGEGNQTLLRIQYRYVERNSCFFMAGKEPVFFFLGGRLVTTLLKIQLLSSTAGGRTSCP